MNPTQPPNEAEPELKRMEGKAGRVPQISAQFSPYRNSYSEV